MFQKLFPKFSAWFSCAKGASLRTGLSPRSSRKSILPACSGLRCGSASTTAISISTESLVKIIHSASASTRDATPFESVGNEKKPAAVASRAAVEDCCTVDVARDGAVGSHGPAMLEVQNCRGAKIQRIRMCPASGRNFAQTDVFPVRPDGHADRIIVTRHSGAITARLLLGKLPGLAVI